MREGVGVASLLLYRQMRNFSRFLTLARCNVCILIFYVLNLLLPYKSPLNVMCVVLYIVFNGNSLFSGNYPPQHFFCVWTKGYEKKSVYAKPQISLIQKKIIFFTRFFHKIIFNSGPLLVQSQGRITLYHIREAIFPNSPTTPNTKRRNTSTLNTLTKTYLNYLFTLFEHFKINFYLLAML